LANGIEDFKNDSLLNIDKYAHIWKNDVTSGRNSAAAQLLLKRGGSRGNNNRRECGGDLYYP
jgi:hypothetical protein